MAYIYSQHTSACQDNHAFVVTVQALMDQWKSKWDHHCPDCHGAGWRWEAGDDSVGMSGFWYICPTCVIRGTCPRCGDYHGHRIEEDTDIEHERITCVECGVVIGNDPMCLAAMEDRLTGLSDCTCEEDRYARQQAAQPSASESPDMSMTEEEVAEYHRTAQVPQSYIQRADRLYKEWQERFRH